MRKIFIIIGSLSVLIVLITTLSFYWVATSATDKANRNALTALANGTSVAIAQQTQQLSKIVQGIALSEEVRQSVNGKNINQLKLIGQRYAAVLPSAMKIRILLPETAKLDVTEVPHLSYADLELIQETFKSEQKPVVQGDKGPNRHLAIAKGVIIEEQVMAVVLASFKYNYLKQSIIKVTATGGRVEIKQGNTVLAAAGAGASSDDLKADAIKLPGTQWMLHMQTRNISDIVGIGIYTSILIGAMTLMGLLFIAGLKFLTDTLRADQASILKITKDLLSGTIQGNYPAKLEGMSLVIGTISQYKRVMTDDPDPGIDGIIEAGNQDDFSLLQFFEEMPDGDDTSNIKSAIQDKPANKKQPAVKKQTAESNRIEPVIAAQPTSTEDFFEDAERPLTIPETPKPLSNIYQANAINGEFGKSLSTDIIHDIGQAIGSELHNKGVDSVVIARDARHSSQALRDALVKGLMSSGINILDIGVVPTPALYFAAHYHESRSGIMITGSPKPMQYNGVKIMLKGEVLIDKGIQQLKSRVEKSDFVNSTLSGAVEINTMLINEYLGAVTEEVHMVRPMKVVVDCGYGVTSELVPSILKTMGCEVIELHCNRDENSANHITDPSKREYYNALINAVDQHQADVGFAFDGDGARLGVVDSAGQVIWPDRQMMLYAKDVLKLVPGAKVIYDPMCSDNLVEEIAKRGGQPIMAQCGYGYVRQYLKQANAKLAGEMSGHIFFNDRWFGFDDAIYAAARMIEILSVDSRPSTEVFAEFPDRPHNLNYSLAMSEAESVRFVAKLAEVAIFPDGKVSCLDCLRVEFSDGWGVARPSRSTGAVVFRFEADTKAALVRIRDDFKQYMAQVKPGMKIPF